METCQMTHDQIILLGGTGSIGIATAELLAAQGAHIAITGRNLETLPAVAQRVPNLRTYQCEITDEASVREVFSNFARIDHVVVLAGSGSGGSVMDTPAAALRFVIEERIWGALYAVQAAVPKMRNGSITFTSGLFSKRPPQHGAAVLVAALAAVEGLARALARELAPIRVNAISFGLVRSTRHRGLGNQQNAYYEHVGSSLPRGRVGEAHEAAHAITFALMNEYLTGEVLHVDGGGRLV
jgi:NAD(P)-dependent dehydrogenase (short-subunit alcohol dehydrogenase family)